MTANQTIDGLSRAALEILLSGKGGLAQAAAAHELRAQLDAPACKTPSGAVCPGDGVGKCKKCPAAQPQGEPVAWMYRREGGECLGQLVQVESDNLKDMREGKVVEGRRILWPREDYIDWRPLYAEPPAQVAVVLPERKHHVHQGLSHTDAKADGWNACIDEVNRLNTPQ